MGKNFLQKKESGAYMGLHLKVPSGDVSSASWQSVLKKQALILNQVVNMWVYVLVF